MSLETFPQLVAKHVLYHRIENTTCFVLFFSKNSFWSECNPAAKDMQLRTISPSCEYSQNTLCGGCVQTVYQGFNKRHLFASIFHYNYRVLRGAAKEVGSKDHGQV